MGCGCSTERTPAANDAVSQIMPSVFPQGLSASNDAQAADLAGSTTSSGLPPGLPTWTRTIRNATAGATGAVDEPRRTPHGRDENVVPQPSSEAQRSREPSEHLSWVTVASRRRTGGSVSGIAGTRTPRTDCSPSFERSQRTLLESPVLLDEQRREPSFELAACNLMNCSAFASFLTNS